MSNNQEKSQEKIKKTIKYYKNVVYADTYMEVMNSFMIDKVSFNSFSSFMEIRIFQTYYLLKQKLVPIGQSKGLT